MKLAKAFLTICLMVLLTMTSLLHAQQGWTARKINDNIVVLSGKQGPSIGYSKSSGIKILIIDGKAFKDLNRNGKLDVYEDWRQPVSVRAKDLAAKMSIDQIAGLMLYSAHQMIPSAPVGFGAGTYGGKPIEESGVETWQVSDQQKAFLLKDNLRHVLVTRVQSAEVAAKWNNAVQSLIEGAGLGIPANNSSDPRNGIVASTEYNLAAGGNISMWPEEIGLAATFSPAIVQRFGQVAAKEYRALGIATALSPQVDLATEPRWSRVPGTFGEDPLLSTDMSRAYIDGFQTSFGKDEIGNGWGFASVNAMVKHWPGGGPEEGGRDAHFAYGKFAVYPGNNFNTHLLPFTEGAFKLNGKTRSAAAVMPYYTISYGRDIANKENVGNGYSKYLVTDLLRKKYNYDGVVCTDWLITADEGKSPDVFAGKSWGVEKLTIAERHYKILMAGVDQFGGNNDAGPVMEAYRMGVKEHGEVYMRERFEQSAVRLLRNIFQVGLFENPYLDPAASARIVGNPGFMKAGFEAQLKSIVLVKNISSALPVAKTKTIYVPKQFTPKSVGWFGNVTPEKIDYPVNMDLVRKYFNVTDDPDKADIAIIFAKGPIPNVGYDKEERTKSGNGYIPISLQYGPYTADLARKQSMAAGDPVVDPSINNRSYYGKTVTAANYKELQNILDTKKAMKGKPVIVSLSLVNPAIVAEFEKEIDGLLISFGVQDQALLEILSGRVEPSGLLPLQMPADMKTVETQLEDLPHDMIPYRDSQGHVYDFAFGMNWKGIISDERTKKYKVTRK